MRLMASLYLINPGLEPRLLAGHTQHAGQWYSGHVALSGVQRVYPGVYSREVYTRKDTHHGVQ